MKAMLTKGWVLLALLIVGVGLAGVGYAVWAQQMQVEGVVVTNNLDLNYTKAFTNDDNKIDDANKDDGDTGLCPPDATSCDPSGPGNIGGVDPRYTQDIGTCLAVIDAASTGSKIQMHLLRVYPSYWCTMWNEMTVGGTVPVYLNAIKLNGTEIVPSTYYDIDADQDGDKDFAVHVSELTLCKKQHPTDIVQSNVDTHVLQGVDEAETTSYELEFVWNIFNEKTPECPDGAIENNNG